ncbi:hypothetical protein D3C87_1566050 [compost metagenome]
MRAEASPSAAPGARLNDTVTDGSCPWWLTEIGPTRRSVVAKAETGTIWPVLLRT